MSRVPRDIQADGPVVGDPPRDVARDGDVDGPIDVTAAAVRLAAAEEPPGEGDGERFGRVAHIHGRRIELVRADATEHADAVPVPSCHDLRVAVLLPCRNEAATIGDVVRSFGRVLPNAETYVYDNGSTDGTAAIARAAGATVRDAYPPGKGHVIRRMFAEIDADVYVLADGDGTYDVESAPELIDALCRQSLDMVVGRRVEASDAAALYRTGHRFGNRMLTGMVRRLFGATCQDMLSGYRVFSRRYVKSFPAFSNGFETETEMTVHALDLMMPICEVDTDYRERPEESASKLRTVRDGVRILRFILRLFKEYMPVKFFGILALLSGVMAGVLAARGSAVLPVRLAGQLAIASVGLGIVLATAGVILDTVTRSRREMKRIMYLSQPYGPPVLDRAGEPVGVVMPTVGGSLVARHRAVAT